MSSEAVAWVYRHSPFRGVPFAVHQAIADSANDQYAYEFWMDLDRLSRKARASERQTRAALAALVEEGFLEQMQKGGGRGNASRWKLLFPRSVVVFETGIDSGDSVQPPHSNGAKGGSHDRKRGNHRRHPPSINPSNPNADSENSGGGVLPILTDEDLRLREHLAGIDPSLPTDRAQPEPSPNPKGAEQARRAAKELH